MSDTTMTHRGAQSTQYASTAVAVVLSLITPGAGLYYAGRAVREAVSWLVGAYSLTIAVDIVVGSRGARELATTGIVALLVHTGAAAHTFAVLSGRKTVLLDVRRYPALSFVLPGLGQIRAGAGFTGGMWMLGYVLLLLASQRLSGGTAWLVLTFAYALISAFSAYRAVSQRHDPASHLENA